jgi:hypothetical protein
MPKYIAIFGTERPFTPQQYPTLFKFFERFPHGVHFKSGVIAFEFDGDSEATCAAIYEHLGDGDELSIFQVSACSWRVDRLKNGAVRDKQMREFLGMDT